MQSIEYSNDKSTCVINDSSFDIVKFDFLLLFIIAISIV